MGNLRKDDAVIILLDGLLYRGLVESAIYANDKESETEFTSISILIGSAHNTGTQPLDPDGEVRFGESVDVTDDNIVGVLESISGFEPSGSALSFIGMFLREFAPEVFSSLHWCSKPHCYLKECWVAGGLTEMKDPMAGTAIDFLMKRQRSSSAHTHF